MRSKKIVLIAALAAGVLTTVGASATTTRTEVGHYGRFEPHYGTSVSLDPPHVSATTERIDLHLCETNDRWRTPEWSLTKVNTSCGYAINAGEISLSVVGEDASGGDLGGRITFTDGVGGGNGCLPSECGLGSDLGAPIEFCGSISGVPIPAGATWVDIEWGSPSQRDISPGPAIVNECPAPRTTGSVTVTFLSD